MTEPRVICYRCQTPTDAPEYVDGEPYCRECAGVVCKQP